MSEHRLNELEVRYSHLENTLQELSEVVWRQQRELDVLRELVQRLQGRVEADTGVVDANRVDRPPHY
jgi:SlyX protein